MSSNIELLITFYKKFNEIFFLVVPNTKYSDIKVLYSLYFYINDNLIHNREHAFAIETERLFVYKE
jgi:hypothetical protein